MLHVISVSERLKMFKIFFKECLHSQCRSEQADIHSSSAAVLAERLEPLANNMKVGGSNVCD
ncbi:hypothetical protein NQ317_006215 [Molorchus minor]|uniref:Uncharacterized protein n=1 Tax=Molorchus minor TaxID=1323400 RepID=A0ABQ9K6R9_9CUCU|nr:hypothetical protein NQ317_006215 [Molorchus minor]